MFPYPRWRPGQKQIARKLSEELSLGKIVLLNYPTGAGKTIVSLYASLKTARSQGLRILYLVRTRNQMASPLKELKKISQQTPVNYSFLINRRDLCALKGVEKLPYREFSRFCRRLIKEGKCPFYQKFVTIGKEILSELTVFSGDPGRFYKKSVEIGICPYEALRSIFPSSDVTILSYNYIFDKSIRENALGLKEDDLKKYILIIDEAHNLPSNISSLFSQTIFLSTVKMALREIRKVGGEVIASHLNALLNYLNMQRGYDFKEVDKVELLSILPPLSEMEKMYYLVEKIVFKNKVSEGYFPRILEFTRLLHQYTGHVLVEAGFIEGEPALRAVLVNPAVVTSTIFSKVNAAVLMSGTMPPPSFMKTLLGLPVERTVFLGKRPDFSQNVRVTVVKNISSRLTERNENTYRRMAEIITKLFTELQSGICLAVFPSYDFLKSVRVFIGEERVFVERHDTSLDELSKAVSSSRKLLVLAAAWGKLTEGIELRRRGRSLIKCVIIAGLPVPEPSPANRRLEEILSYKVGKDVAWDYVYMVPALIKVAQSIGRAIRSPRDKVCATILDHRVLEEKYISLLRELGFRKINIAEEKCF